MYENIEPGMPSNLPNVSQEVRIPVQSVELRGDLFLPLEPRGLVIFSHGSGSGRFSPRNKFVARQLNDTGFGTLLLDLLTEQEDTTFTSRFDIALLTDRLMRSVNWTLSVRELVHLPIGLFGASTGAASALRVAARMRNHIAAVVSRGGRPDLAGSSLTGVICPCLFIVGGNDRPILPLNEDALRLVSSKEKQIVVVPHAGHLFEEGDTLQQVAQLSAQWFEKHLPGWRGGLQWSLESH